MAKLTENLKLEVPEGSDTFTRASYAKLITDIDERVASKQDLDGEADVLHSKTTDIDGRVKRHISDKNNPHNVTKAQVGLGNVQNYPIANVTQVEDGTATNAYMTPATTKLAIDKHAGDALKGHTDNYNNPHKVTKSQVGLGNVQNYSPATTADAEAGTATNKYMTPITTKKAIDKYAGDAVKDHTENYNNPHNVTKAQVGLNNVDNVKQATKTEHDTLKSRVDNLHAKDIEVTSAILKSTSVDKALDELFTYADDVHARWASSVGAPLKKSDTAEVKEKKTKDMLNDLIVKLKDHGIKPVNNDLQSIINSVGVDKIKTENIGKTNIDPVANDYNSYVHLDTSDVHLSNLIFSRTFNLLKSFYTTLGGKTNNFVKGRNWKTRYYIGKAPNRVEIETVGNNSLKKLKYVRTVPDARTSGGLRFFAYNIKKEDVNQEFADNVLFRDEEGDFQTSGRYVRVFLLPEPIKGNETEKVISTHPLMRDGLESERNADYSFEYWDKVVKKNDAFNGHLDEVERYIEENSEYLTNRSEYIVIINKWTDEDNSTHPNFKYKTALKLHFKKGKELTKVERFI